MRGAAVELRGLAPGDYLATWWHTREGRIMAEQPIALGAGEVLRLEARPFHRDIACRLLVPQVLGVFQQTKQRGNGRFRIGTDLSPTNGCLVNEWVPTADRRA